MRLERFALLAGLGLFLWLLHGIGLGVVVHNLGQIGWGFAAVLALEAVVVILTTLGSRRTLPALRRVRFRSLLAMRIAGDGVNALAPAAVVGGELVRARLLARYVPGAEALGSVGLAAMAQFLAQVLFVGLGATVARGGGLQPRLRLFGLALLAFLVVFLAVLDRISRRRESPPPRLGRLLDRVGRLLGGSSPREGFWRDLESQVFGAVRERPGDLALSVLFFLGGWSLGVVEVGLVLKFLGTPAPVGTALSIAVLAVLVEGVFFFVPARVGVQEGGLYAIFLALGLNPAKGFSLGLVRRLRELAWALAGLTILGLHRRRRPPGITEVRSELPDSEASRSPV
ncbi:MAG TPA: lysylphosphatidylglycerol synthase domain-containing protein [Thermoanaerobaculia bacterium]|nr:lysylphosphatidylglycerol synthase domain-containing protein [Thermoanaerobaculia bacterium]